MFGIGFTELIVLAVVALIFVGPDRLPQFMKQIGKLFVHTRRMATDVRSAMDTVIRDAEKEIRIKEIEEMKANLKNASESLKEEARDILTIEEQKLAIEKARAEINSKPNEESLESNTPESGNEEKNTQEDRQVLEYNLPDDDTERPAGFDSFSSPELDNEETSENKKTT